MKLEKGGYTLLRGADLYYRGAGTFVGNDGIPHLGVRWTTINSGDPIMRMTEQDANAEFEHLRSLRMSRGVYVVEAPRDN